MIIVFTTVSNSVEAESLARKIVEARLAACVQVLPALKSFYYWENEIREDSEHLLLIKTLAEKYAELEQFISENHSYDVPEITAVESVRVSGTYSGWLNDYLE